MTIPDPLTVHDAVNLGICDGIHVYLDGEPVRHVIEASPIGGYVVRYATDAAGVVRPDFARFPHSLQVERLTGVVTVEYRPALDHIARDYVAPIVAAIGPDRVADLLRG